MNKRDVVTKVSLLSGLEYSDCDRVIESLAQVLGEELKNSRGIRAAFGKLHKLMDVLKK